MKIPLLIFDDSPLDHNLIDILNFRSPYLWEVRLTRCRKLVDPMPISCPEEASFPACSLGKA